ncbi:MAG: glycosyltransferase family 39 protein, partial [Deltaproteobacteria bacterium]|nr:glycosyltransferase family 39 protein [Deltaproteobacteria bacterium]
MLRIDRAAIAVFVIALICRGLFFSQVFETSDRMLQPDSRMYIELAQGLNQHGTLAFPGNPGIPSADRMPGYSFFLAAVWEIFGEGPLPVVVIQILLDSLSCVFVVHIAEILGKGIGPLAGILASVNVGMITYSHFLLNDSLFVFLFLLAILGTFRFLVGPLWGNAFVLGLLIGLAALVRQVIVYLPVVLLPFLFFFLHFRRRVSLTEAAGKTLLIGLIFLSALLPWMCRNYVHFGRLQLTSQSGEHLLQYVVPFVWQHSRGVPFIQGMEQANKAFQARAREEGLDVDGPDPFLKSDLQVKMALEFLEGEPKTALLKAWLLGALKNLFSPSIIDLSYLLKIERPHFFYTEGKSALDRTLNFLRGMKGWFGWAVLGSLALLGLARVAQGWGAFRLMRGKPWEGLF